MSNTIDVAAWRAVLLTQSRVFRAIERDLYDAGAISLGWYDVLLELNAAPGRQLRMQELAGRAVLSRTRVSRIVSELEAVGFVERVSDPADRRAWLATLTTEGRTALKRTAPLYLDGIDRHFNRLLSADDRRRLVRILQPVVDAHQADLDLRR
jgi:DNA-binding MarR family transcriptional regulator